MSIAGTWNISMNTPMGPQSATLTISEEGGAFKGSLTDPMGGPPSELEDLAIDGTRFTCKAEVNSPMGKMLLDLDGTADGDSISGNFSTPMGPLPYSGQRG